MWGGKTIPDKERLSKERPVTKALEFPFFARERVFSLELERRVRECTQRDRMTDMVAGYHQVS